ncbi:MAG: response regulator [Deltaproteobacteria bacterium]|nr:response regulator [Deltaproteobacteria bacterium]
MSRARILAVDDQRYFRELVEGLLKDEGFEVRTASSGEEALGILERELFEVVVTDLVMPGIDGAELVHRIKEWLPEQEIVVVSGVVDAKTAVEAMKLGATDYICKPFDGPDLIDSIEKILQRSQLRNEHARLMEENLEFMGVLSLFERVAGLFSTLAVEPLAERLVEGLCLETRVESAVVWVAREIGASTLELAGARGLIRVGKESQTLDWVELVAAVPSLVKDQSTVVSEATQSGEGEMLYVPLRFGGETLGVVRLADKLDGTSFTAGDRATCEKFCTFGATAIRNALRFQALERRTLRDPDTHTYTQAYFEEAVRYEIDKASRFGNRFSILRLQLETDSLADSDSDFSPDVATRRVREIVKRVESALRSMDLLASSNEHGCWILLPQTDALGAGILAQRLRKGIIDLDESDAGARMFLTAATYPVDGAQLESLFAVLDDRLKQSHDSLLAKSPEFARSEGLDPLLDRMLEEQGSVEAVEMEGQILRFVLEDIVRRPADRGLLFVSPGTRWLTEVLETLHEMDGRTSRTEIVLIAEAEQQEASPYLTWSTKSALDSQRPFLVYFGDGPAYAMIGQVTEVGERAPIFQTADRALVEHLTFELQRELGISISV